MDLLNPYYLQIVMFFIINAIMGISIYFTLASGQLSLGAAGFMSVGAYVGAILSLKADLPIVLGIIIGGLVASLVAVISVYQQHVFADYILPLLLLVLAKLCVLFS